MDPDCRICVELGDVFSQKYGLGRFFQFERNRYCAVGGEDFLINFDWNFLHQDWKSTLRQVSLKIAYVQHEYCPCDEHSL